MRFARGITPGLFDLVNFPGYSHNIPSLLFEKEYGISKPIVQVWYLPVHSLAQVRTEAHLCSVAIRLCCATRLLSTR